MMQTSRSLLRFLTKSVRNDVMEKNMHIVYALVYRKAELDSILSANRKFCIEPFYSLSHYRNRILTINHSCLNAISRRIFEA